MVCPASLVPRATTVCRNSKWQAASNSTGLFVVGFFLLPIYIKLRGGMTVTKSRCTDCILLSFRGFRKCFLTCFEEKKQ